MFWLIALCVVTIISTTMMTKSSEIAKHRFISAHPGGIDPNCLSQEVRNCLVAGKGLRVLKQFRKETGMGLKDAKEVLDTIVAESTKL